MKQHDHRPTFLINSCLVSAVLAAIITFMLWLALD
jgi:hypothetical protein